VKIPRPLDENFVSPQGNDRKGGENISAHAIIEGEMVGVWQNPWVAPRERKRKKVRTSNETQRKGWTLPEGGYINQSLHNLEEVGGVWKHNEKNFNGDGARSNEKTGG